MKKSKRIAWAGMAIAVGVALSVLISCTIVSRIWDSLCGNYRMSIYGRVVGEHGYGIANVEVTFQILYSDRIATKAMYGRAERVRALQVYTDEQGNFEFENERGYSVSIRRFKGDSGDLGFWGPRPYPDSGWVFDDALGVASAPTNAKKRITYRMAPLQTLLKPTGER